MKNSKNSQGFAPILVILIVLGLIFGVYYFGTLKNKENLVPYTPTITTIPTPTSSPIVLPTPALGSASNCVKNQALNLLLTLPSGWTCVASYDYDGGSISAKSDTFNVSVSDGGRGPYCGDGPDPDDSCKTRQLILSDKLTLTIFNFKGEDKEIFGSLGQTSQKTNRYVSITYKDMETKPLTDSQKQELLQFLNSLKFTN